MEKLEGEHQSNDEYPVLAEIVRMNYRGYVRSVVSSEDFSQHEAGQVFDFSIYGRSGDIQKK